MANLLDLVKKLRDNLALSNQQSPYNQALNKLSAGTAGFRKNTTDLVIGKPAEVLAIGLMGDKKRASYNPVFYNEKDTLKSYSGDVARGALNTVLMGKGLASPKMLATVTGLNTGFATGGAAYSNTKKPKDMRVNPLMTGIKDTATNFPRLSQSAGLYTWSNPLTDRVLKTAGVTSKVGRLTGIGVGNVGEDVVLSKLNKERFTPQQAAVSFLAPFAFEGATQTFRAGGHGLEDVLAKLRELNKGMSSGAIDLNAKVSIPKIGSIEQIHETQTGWKPGQRLEFDRALYNKDIATVVKMLPDVPLEYRRSFEAEIEKVVSQGKFQPGFARLNGGISDNKTPKPQATDANPLLVSPKTDSVPQTFKTEKFNVTSQEEKVLLKTLKGLGLDERDVRSFDEMRVIGEELLGDPRNLLKDIESGRIKDSEIVALGDIISTSSKRISTLTKSLKKNPTDPKLLAQLDAEETLINQAIKKRVKGGTEAGRAVVAFRLLAKNNMEPTYWLTRAQKQLGDRPITQEQVNAINKLIESNDRLGIARFVSLLGESTTREKAVALWKAGLLTSPRTHLANIASNTLFAPLETLKDIPATGFDVVRSALTKTPRAKSFSAKSITSQGGGFLRGVDQAGKYLEEGVDPREVAKLDVYRQIRFGDTKGGRFAQKYVDGVFRFLGAEDKIFREMAFSRSLVDQAGVIAKNKNLSAGELNDLLSNPSKEMVDIAARDAGVATFNNENALADAVRRFKSGDTALATATDFVMPFVRTPTNVVMRMIDYTPAGVTKTTVQKMLNKSSVTDRELADAFGRSATGLAVIWAGYQLANAGMFQGATPSSEAERSQMYLEGKNPGSILVNGTWYQINKLSPVYPLLSIGASLAESKSVYKAGLQGLKSVADSPFVMGMAGLTEAITDPERDGEKYVQSAVGGFTPNIVKDLARGGDVMRQQDTMSDSLFGGLPGFRQNLPARVDALGNVIPENNLGNALLNPLRPREATRDPVILELARVGYNLNYVGGTIGDTKLTPEQQRAYQRLAGAKIREVLVPLFNSEKYTSLDPDQQQTAIEKAVNKAKADAREELKPKLSTIAKGSDRGSRIKAYENEGGEVNTLDALTKDPFGTLEALTSGQPIRKLRGNTVVVEREKGLASGDQGNRGTQVDHVVPLALGGGNKLRNQYILTASENNQKSMAESKLARELEAGIISKSEAKRRLKNWRSEVKDVPSKDMAAVTEEKQPTVKPATIPTSIKSPVLRDIASRTYKGIWNDKKGENDDPISIELPETPKITGNADLDKTMLSKFSSQLTTQSNNIVKLYQDGQLTAKEANDALVAIKELKATASAVTKKPKKAKKAPKLVIKEIIKPSKTGASIKGLTSAKAPAKVKISAYKPKSIKIAGKKYVKIKAKPFKNTFGSALTKLA